MKRTLLFCFISILLANYVNAQTKQAVELASKCTFQSFNTLQVLDGSSSTSLAFHSVNGFRFNKFFAGIGTGLDHYFVTTIPLFAEARYEVLNGKNKLNFFANTGFNFAFNSGKLKQENVAGYHKPGGMYGAGIDYLLPSDKQAVIIGVAYSNKQVIQMIESNTWNPASVTVENIPIREHYSFHRLVLRLGLRF